ncbi:MAG: DUF1801 domain-containing protein [Phycisphaerales bacterium]|nr:DUF1801 domain-containing protein [Phycisphaerales bacterium]
MRSDATTVKEYLAALTPDRRKAIEAVRKAILDNLDDGYEEGIQYGMIGYHVPHSVYPAGYHCDPSRPVPFAGLASQKNYMSLYLMTAYGEGVDDWLPKAWAKAGKKLDMGKCCIRFKRLEDVPLDVVGEAIRRVPCAKYIKQYQQLIKQNAAASKPRKAASKAK